MIQLAGGVALVTGAPSGIGGASALLLARQDAELGVLGRTRDQLDETVGEIRDDGGEALLEG